MTNEKTEFDDKGLEKRIVKAAGRLETSIAPRRDLWPGIRASIQTSSASSIHGSGHTAGQTAGNASSSAAASLSRRPWRMPYLAQAAAVILLIGASSAVTYLVTASNTSVSPVSVAGDSGELVLRQASFGGDYQLSAEYKLAHSGLQAQLNERLARLSPEARAGVEQNLEVIRNAIAEINAALEQEPGNTLLQGLLLDTYREELAVMKKVGGLTHDVMSRNDI